MMIIFTDLDGTLIDFETYSAEITTPRVRQLLDEGIPVVFCSSKTRVEQRTLMQNMGIDTLGIVENGSGIYVPQKWAIFPDQQNHPLPDGGRLIPLGTSATDIQEKIKIVSADLDIDLKPYASLSNQALAAVTGLTEDAAGRARQRDFSETLTAKLEPHQWTEVQNAFASHHLQCLCGGRFYTVSAANCNKGTALDKVVEAHMAECSAPVTSIAIGDSFNDVDMLKAADFPYLVQQPSGIWHDIALPGLQRIPAVGPAGWLAAIAQAKDTLS